MKKFLYVCRWHIVVGRTLSYYSVRSGLLRLQMNELEKQFDVPLKRQKKISPEGI